MKNVMIDIETLDTNPGGVILSIGAVYFHEHGLGKTFYKNIDLLSSILSGFTISRVTSCWWSKQDKKAIDIFNKDPTTLIGNALEDLSRYIEKGVRVWAKGPDFDLVLLKAAYDKMGMKIPWSFRDARDVRTAIWFCKDQLRAVAGLYPTPFIKHFALHDAVYQANCVRAACSILKVDLNKE